ncbi:fumarylacetoacetate hydrolase family protein [Dactylosporangium sucinum]|uniref:Fumarylacetoacetase-like C-terminal domain-containing protein n=1 Tax=Dactylosporangium sucinum TaxID=1424081 RepID=A0A917SZ32_9ACTN|nr:fumarylacetoacetate hydrolase family protein [Dactylosporangium sucinum]GGM03004.1 hypothetical protein GCM10007977_000490 [Dactylosporangium sucinum]
MFLARVRVGAGPVVLTARISPDSLLRLDRLGVTGDDPVSVLTELGLDTLTKMVREAVEAGIPADRLLRVDEVTFESPVPAPSKIVCVALNYVAHAEEGEQAVPQEPVVFFKPPSSLTGHGATVHCPARSQRLDYEIELAVVIGTTARDVPEADWERVVLGYTVLNDVTARDLQLVAIERNQPWDLTKAFDTFAPCGPYLVTPDEIADPMNLDLTLTVDGAVRQQSNTKHMVFSIGKLIEVISDGMTLVPGDIIATGTPSGIGPVPDGGVMVATVESVGTLTNPVAYARVPAP